MKVGRLERLTISSGISDHFLCSSGMRTIGEGSAADKVGLGMGGVDGSGRIRATSCALFCIFLRSQEIMYPPELGEEFIKGDNDHVSLVAAKQLERLLHPLIGGAGSYNKEAWD